MVAYVNWLVFSILLQLLQFSYENEDYISPIKTTVEGKVPSLKEYTDDWALNTIIHVDGGQYIGFVRNDGSFAVHNVPPGSYVFQAVNPDFDFEPVRVDVNSKGKIRVRKVNYIQSSQVEVVPHPIKFRLRGPINYFQKRETWRITDMLLSPMVLMMVLPLVVIGVLPKLINTQDPETQKELQNQMSNMPKYDMPDLSEMFTSLLGGSTKSTVKSKGKRRKD